MTYILWFLMIGLDGVPYYTPVGTEPLTRNECHAIARFERSRNALNPWAGKTFVWCDPASGFPAHRD